MLKRLFGVVRRSSKKILTLAAASVMAFSGMAVTTPMFFNGQAAAASPGDVLINEVDSGASSNDWIELYNPGSTSISLSGWTATDSSNNAGIFASSTISGHGYVVVTFGNYLNNSGDTVTLKDASANTIDSVIYGAGGYAAPASGKALARTTNGGSDWTSTATPTQGTSNDPNAELSVCVSGCDDTTVSAAIAAIGGDGTIYVGAGDFSSQGTVAVSKAVNLVGAQSDVAAANSSTGVERSGSESSIAGFSISSSNVTINGFSVTSVSITAPGSTILSGLDIENNIFSGYSSVGLPTYDAGNIAIQNNYFANPVGSSEAMQIKASSVAGGCNSTQVLNNVFNAATNNGGADINFSCTGSNSATAIVSGNYSSGNSGGSSLAAFSGVDNDIEITNNVAVTSGSTIFFFGNVSGSTYVSGNNFSGGAGNGISIYGGDAGTSDSSNSGTFTITNNNLSGNNSALKLSTDALTGAGKVVASNNDLSGSTSNVAVNNLSTGSVDATDNYWGTSPDFSTLIGGTGSANVTYTPYYLNPARTHLNTELPSTVYVDSSYSASSAGGYEYGWDAFSTIQEALNMVASNGTIHIAAGTYDSFSVNGKSGVTIEGAGAGSTIVAPSSLITTGVGHKYTADMSASVFVNNSTSVTIQGMTIHSTSAAPGNGGADAIVFWNASTGTIQDSDVTGIYTINGDQTGQGVAVDAGSNQTTNLTLSDVNISGFQKNAIDAVDGNGGTSTGDTVNVNVEGGSIQGAGSIDTIAQNGVLVWNMGGGTVTGQVNGVNISDLEYSDPSNQDVGIYAYGSAAFTSVQDNDLSSVDLYVVNGSGAAIDASTGNSFDGVSPASASDAQLAAIESKLDGGTEDSSLKAIYVLPNTLIATTDTGVQAAIDAASAGDTVLVLPGTYNENVSITKALTLSGAQTGVDGRNRTSASESVINGTNVSVDIETSNVTLDGFTVSGGTNAGVFIDPGASNVTVKDNILTGNSIALYGNCAANCLVQNNEFKDDNLSGAAGGAGIYTDMGSHGLSIDSNDFTGLQLNSAIIIAATSATTNSNLTVTNNTIENNNSNNSMVYIVGLNGGTISGNTISQAGATDLKFAGAVSNVTVSGNHLTNSATGLKIADDGYGFGDNSAISLSKNDFSGDSVGVANLSGYSGTLDASLNYWGSTSPDFDSLATSGVTYSPWYTNSAMGNIASTSSNITTTSSSAGTASLPSGSTSVSLDSSTRLDVSSGLSGSVGGNITVDGTTQSLSNYSGGSLSGANLTNVTVGGSTLSVELAVNLQSGSSGQPVTITNTNLSNVTVSLPDSTTILAPSSWDGTITPPTTVTATGTAPSGFAVGSTVIEVGSPSNVLLFDKPVMVELDGVTGQVGYKTAGSSTWQLIPACANTDYNTAQDPGFPGACSVTDGTNTKIWTYHFTQFANMNTVSSSRSGGNSSSGSSSSHSGGTGSNSAQSSSNSESDATNSSGGSVKGISTSANAGKTSSLSTTKPKTASLNQPKAAAKEVNGLRWYWIVVAAIVALGLAAATAYRLAEGTDKTA